MCSYCPERVVPLTRRPRVSHARSRPQLACGMLLCSLRAVYNAARPLIMRNEFLMGSLSVGEFSTLRPAVSRVCSPPAPMPQISPWACVAGLQGGLKLPSGSLIFNLAIKFAGPAWLRACLTLVLESRAVVSMASGAPAVLLWSRRCSFA
jgi:hypothetical protein